MIMHPRGNGLLCSLVVALLWLPGVLDADVAPLDREILVSKKETLLRLRSQGETGNVLPLAEDLLASLENAGAGPLDLAWAHREIGHIQFGLSRFDQAEAHFAECVAQTESAAGAFGLQLVPVLQDLAAALYKQDHFEEAESALHRAQHILHREGGVHTLDQLQVVDALAAIKLKTHEYTEADRQERFYYEISASNYGEDDERMLPAMTRLGRWFRRSGQLESARRMYHRIVERLKGLPDRSPLEQVEPLREISGILYIEGACCADDPLEEVVAIVEQDPGADRRDKADAILQLADLAVLERHARTANALYHRMWNTMGEESASAFARPMPLGISASEDVVHSFRKALEHRRANSIDTRNFAPPGRPGAPGIAFSWHHKADQKAPPGRLVGSPVPLCYPQVMDLVHDKDLERFRDFSMKLEFAVDETGHVEDVRVLESNTPRRLGGYVRNMLRAIRFRPRLEGGKPVATDRVVWDQTFSVEEETADAQAADARTADPRPLYPLAAAAVFEGCRQLTASR